MHGLHFMEFDTERVANLIESMGDFLTKKHIEKQVLELQVDSECNKSDDEAEEDGGITIKVTKLRKKSSVKATQGGVGNRTQSESREGYLLDSKVPNRHMNCAGNVIALKNEISNKNQ